MFNQTLTQAVVQQRVIESNKVKTNGKKVTCEILKNISVIHQNVQSLGNVVERIESELKEHPECEVLCITEHWKSEDQIKYLTIRNFKLISSLCRGELEHGGSAVYVKKNIKARPREDLKVLSIIGVFECAATECKLGSMQAIVVSIYRPCNGNMRIFFNRLEELLQITFKEGKCICITGDFNIQMHCENREKSELYGLMSSFNLHHTINDYTRVTSSGKSCIDNIFTNVENYRAIVFDMHVSDHRAQKIIFSCKSVKEDLCRMSRCFSEEAKSNFLLRLREQDWQTVYQVCTVDVNSQWDTFTSVFLQVFNECFPVKMMRPGRNRHVPDDPEICNCKNRLDVLLMLSRQNKNYSELYNKTKKEYDRLLVKHKSNLYQKKIYASDNKNKTMWAICNEIGGKVSKGNECQVEGDAHSIANEFNVFFNDSISSLVDNVPDYVFSCSNFTENDRTLYLRPTTPEEIVELAKSIKNKQSSGEDEIPASIVKYCIHEIKNVLSYIVNHSFKQGTFPQKLKLAVIKPLLKAGNPEDMNNYRQVSLLPSFSKLFELAICQRVMRFLWESNVFSDTQHGYLAGRSTQTAIFDFTQSIIGYLEKNKLALGIFLDLSKAYDLLNREYLVRKLYSYGIRGKANEWFQSYLSDRTQRVSVMKDGVAAKSDIIESNIGVAQGSIAGPVLFVIFLNDLCNIISNTDGAITNYADDTNLLVGSETISDLINKGEELFLKAEAWLGTNRLVLNKKKTNIVIFSTSRCRKEKPETVKIKDTQINVSDYTKFLGLYIDKFLQWNRHAEYLHKTLNTVCYAIRLISKYMDRKTLKILYYANFESVFKYGIMFWGIRENLERIFLIQKRVLRIIKGMGFLDSCRGAFKNDQMLTVYGVYLYECLIFLKKNVSKFDNRTNFAYETRSLDINFPLHKLTLTENNPSYMCIRIYNRLPNVIKELGIEDYKTNVKNLLIDLEPYSLADFFK